MDDSEEEPQFLEPVSEDCNLNESTLFGTSEYEGSQVKSYRAPTLLRNDLQFEELSNKTPHLYESETFLATEEEDLGFERLPEDQMIERQFMLEQARIEEALNMIANLEIVAILLIRSRESSQR
jgi:hypothetical protein